MDSLAFGIGHGPVIDLSKDPKNAEIVAAVRLLSLHECFLIVPGVLTIELAILTVLEGRLIGRCCMSWACVSTFH